MKDIRDKQETIWVSAVKKGDAAAFDQLFSRYGKRLYHFSLGYLKSKEEAEEVVQEVFLKIWHNRKALKPELSFKAYLFKIAYRHIQELFQKITKEQAYRHEIVEASIQFNDELDERTNYQSLLELVNKTINQLPKRQKEVLIMRRKDGMPVKEIATELEISVKTVENHLTEALKTLKVKLEKESKVAGLLFFSIFI